MTGPAAASMRASLRRALPTFLAVAAASLGAALPYLSTLTDYFLADDFGFIHTFPQQPLMFFLTLFARPWSADIFGGYTVDELRPFLAFSYWLDSLLGPTNPIGYHISNIVFHLLNVLLIFTIGRAIAGLSLLAATLTALLFAVFPVHTETVAWISGRADSHPAISYLATFLAYAWWRRTGRMSFYWLSVLGCFVALYSKQSAITMLATLIFYDALVERIPLLHIVRSARTYLPFAALTAGYLGLRFILFQNVIREDQLSLSKLIEFALTQATYLQMLFTGRQELRSDPVTPLLAIGGLFAGLVLVVLALFKRKPRASGNSWGLLLYFGPVWWVISVAPLIVTYISSRHLYLAAAGFAVVLGLGFDAAWRRSRAPGRLFAAVAGGGLVLVYGAISVSQVSDWNASAALSQRVTRDVQREAATAPAGSLLVLGAPSTGPNPAVWTWVWGFTLPYPLQPPFAETDLLQRVGVVSSRYVYCCPPEQWRDHSRTAIEAWAARPERPPLIALDWDRGSGALIRRTDRELPALRPAALEMAEAATPEEMMRRLAATLQLARSPS